MIPEAKIVIQANACWLNSSQLKSLTSLKLLQHHLHHTMKLKCEICPQQATYVVGCGNKAACNGCVKTKKCNPSQERATEITQQDAQAMPCDICKSNPVSVVCHEDRAFLCTNCDLKIHSANDFAGHHQRFAFTAAKMAIPEGVSKGNRQPRRTFRSPSERTRYDTSFFTLSNAERKDDHRVKRN